MTSHCVTLQYDTSLHFQPYILYFMLSICKSEKDIINFLKKTLILQSGNTGKEKMIHVSNMILAIAGFDQMKEDQATEAVPLEKKCVSLSG